MASAGTLMAPRPELTILTTSRGRPISQHKWETGKSRLLPDTWPLLLSPSPLPQPPCLLLWPLLCPSPLWNHLVLASENPTQLCCLHRVRCQIYSLNISTQSKSEPTSGSVGSWEFSTRDESTLPAIELRRPRPIYLQGSSHQQGCGGVHILSLQDALPGRSHCQQQGREKCGKKCRVTGQFTFPSASLAPGKDKDDGFGCNGIC